jgi:ferritin-like metal-binding protein YciE
MGLFTKDIKTMNDLFVHQLQDIYYAEKQLVKALPKMAEKATEKQLKQGFLSISTKPKRMFSASRRYFGCTAPR